MENPKFRFSVILGSRSEQKISAVHHFFREFVELRPQQFEYVFQNVDIPSDVPRQPFGVDEIALGARNRACGAYDYLKKNYHPEGWEHISFGIESGLIGSHATGLYFDVAIVVLKTEHFGDFMAMTPGVVIPQKYISDAYIQGIRDTTYGEVMLRLHPEATAHGIPLNPHGFLYPGSGGRAEYLKRGVWEVTREFLCKLLSQPS